MAKMDNMTKDDLVQRLAAFETRLSPREVRIASAIRRDLLNAGRFTIGQIAGQAGVDKSAVSRFARKLDYEKYGDLRDAAWRAGKAQVYDDASLPSSSLADAFGASVNRSSEAFEDVDHAALEDGLKRSATLVAGASRVVLCGIGAGRLLTSACGVGLARLGKPKKTLEVLPKTGEGWHYSSDLPLLIYVPIPGKAEETWTPDLLKFSDAFGPSILWTTSTASLKGHDQDVVLRISGAADLATTATTMVTFSEIFTDVCRSYMLDDR